MNSLTSLQNPKVKQWISLKLRKYRQETGLFLVEGARPVAEALLTHQPLVAIIYCEDYVKTDRARNIIKSAEPNMVWQVSAHIAQRLSDWDEPGEVFGVCQQIDVPLEKLPAVANPFFIVLDEPRGSGNLGTVIRTAEGAGADAVVIIEPAVDLYHPGVVRLTVGSLFGIPIARVPSLADFLQWYEQTWSRQPQAYCIVATPEADANYTSLTDLERPLMVIFGNEERGVAPQLRQLADQPISVKMLGRADSLNTASAAAVIICHVMNKRRGRFTTPQHLRVPQGFAQPKNSVE